MSTFSDFLDANLDRLSGYERVGVREFYRAYVTYADERDEGALPERRFNAKVAEAGFETRREEQGMVWQRAGGSTGPVADEMFETFVAARDMRWDNIPERARHTRTFFGWSGGCVGVRRFYKAYAEECSKAGRKALPERAFNALLRERGFVQERDVEGVHWLGLSIQTAREAVRNALVLHFTQWCGRERAKLYVEPVQKEMDLGWWDGAYKAWEMFEGTVESALWQAGREHVAAHDGCDFTEPCEADTVERFRVLADAIERPIRPPETIPPPPSPPEPPHEPSPKEVESFYEVQAMQATRERFGLLPTVLDQMTAGIMGVKNIIEPGPEPEPAATTRRERWEERIAPEIARIAREKAEREREVQRRADYQARLDAEPRPEPIDLDDGQVHSLLDIMTAGIMGRRAATRRVEHEQATTPETEGM